MLIREAARLSGLSTKTIRYYETTGLLPAAGRNANGYRDYSEDDLQRLRFLRRARSLGFSMIECRSLARLMGNPGRPSRDVKHLAMTKIEAIDRQLDELQAMRRHLAELADQCRGDDGPSCPILDELSGAPADDTPAVVSRPCREAAARPDRYAGSGP